MADPLSRFDRATLSFWRLANGVGWFFVAMLITPFVLMAVGGLVDRIEAVRGPIPSDAETALGLAAFTVAGLAVGTLIGSRMWQSQQFATVAALAPVLLFFDSWSDLAGPLLAIVIAFATTTVLIRRRR